MVSSYPPPALPSREGAHNRMLASRWLRKVPEMKFKTGSSRNQILSGLNGSAMQCGTATFIQEQLDRLPVYWSIITTPTEYGVEYSVLDDNEIELGKHHDLAALITLILHAQSLP